MPIEKWFGVGSNQHAGFGYDIAHKISFALRRSSANRILLNHEDSMKSIGNYKFNIAPSVSKLKKQRNANAKKYNTAPALPAM
jgi:hypothetical protein